LADSGPESERAGHSGSPDAERDSSPQPASGMVSPEDRPVYLAGKQDGEEPGIRIVQIRIQGPDPDAVDIVLTPGIARLNQCPSEGFHLTGNVENRACCLMVRTRDARGDEFVQFLPWNEKDPNHFRLHSPLNGYASVSVYESGNRIGQFLVTDFTDDEMIPLRLDAERFDLYAGI
jgi:hypothetical protein